MKKRIPALTLAALLLLGGCGQKQPSPTQGTAPVEETTVPTEAAPRVVMNHSEFDDAPIDTTVTVETYVQATQEWWNDTISVYAQSEDGGYFLRNLSCTREEAKSLVPGTKLRVTGEKILWAGAYEIDFGTFEILEGYYLAKPLDITSLLGNPALSTHQNEKILCRGLTVAAANDDGDAFRYGFDGAGGEDSDLYLNVTSGDAACTFVVKYYLTGPDSEVYRTVQSLQAGDVVDLEGFLFWNQDCEPHITAITVHSEA